MRWSATFIFSSSTGTRWAKLLWSRTSRVSSSSLVSVTAWLLLLAIRTPTRVTAPDRAAAMTLSIPSPPQPGQARPGDDGGIVLVSVGDVHVSGDALQLAGAGVLPH